MACPGEYLRVDALLYFWLRGGDGWGGGEGNPLPPPAVLLSHSTICSEGEGSVAKLDGMAGYVREMGG